MPGSDLPVPAVFESAQDTAGDLQRGECLEGGDEATSGLAGRLRPAPGRSRIFAYIVIFLGSAILAVGFLTLPNVLPEHYQPDLSLSALLDYAHARGIRLGSELAYTYGPLGYLVFPCFSSYAPVQRIVADVALCFVVALGLLLIAWRLRPTGRVLLPAVFLFAATNIDPRTDLVLQTGLFCWGLLGFVETGKRLVLCIVHTNLWLEVQLEPTWRGWLRQQLFHPPIVRLAVWRELMPGKLLVRKRAPASMVSAGFLASPLLLNTQDVLNLYSAGYSVELLPGEEHFWKPVIRFRLYQLNNSLATGAVIKPYGVQKY